MFPGQSRSATADTSASFFPQTEVEGGWTARVLVPLVIACM